MSIPENTLRAASNDNCADRQTQTSLAVEAQAKLLEVARKSMLPNDERGIDGIMRTINGRKDKSFTAPTPGGFWKSPADVRVAIAKGDWKARQSGEASS